MPSNAITSIGFCGKIPSKGDFVHNDVSEDFLKHWNEWLQSVVAVSKEQLETQWLECYLTSPIWHFSLSAGICSEEAVMGTLIPSVDQVGRHFPFTIAMEHGNNAVDAWVKDKWSVDLEETILEVLDDGFDLDNWFKSLKKKLPNLELEKRQYLNSASGEKVKKAWVIKGEESIVLADLLHLQYIENYGAYSIWWTQGSDLVEPCFIVTDGLPQVSQFVSMLNGQWEAHSWNTCQIIKEE